MSTIALVLWVPALVAAMGLPSASSSAPPAMDHHGIVWRSGPVRRERLQWWATLAVGVAVAGTILALLANHGALIEATHGGGPHAHFALTRGGILTASPTGWQPWTLLPPVFWLLPIPLLSMAALAVPSAALLANWRLAGSSAGVSIQRAWPWHTREIAWSDVTMVYAAGATLHIETRQGAMLLRADGAELDVAAVAAWLAAARDQVQADVPASQTGSAPTAAIQALRVRAATRLRTPTTLSSAR